MKTTTLDELFTRYDAFLLDAYGVLVTSAGALPGARAWIDRLHASGRAYFVLTNDASRTAERAAAFYQSQGLAISADRVITAGHAIGPALQSVSGVRLRCFVFGTEDTRALVAHAGHTVLDFDARQDCDAVVVGDDSGFDFLPAVNAVLTSLHRQISAGRRPQLCLVNSDLLYPRGEGGFGFTSGAIARLLELGLQQLHPDQTFAFEVLGKPSRRIFDLAIARTGVERARIVMFGDQLHTDVRGAHAAGIDSVLVGTGVTRLPLPTALAPDHTPTFVLPGLGNRQ